MLGAIWPLPVLPWFMGSYVDALSAATQRVCGEAEFPRVHFLDIDFAFSIFGYKYCSSISYFTYLFIRFSYH